MANFSQLPNEMVSAIWGCILDPKDIESFAVVSKSIYSLGRPFVEEHNEMKKRYSCCEDKHGRPSSIPELFKAILHQPRIALYVTHLYIASESDYRFNYLSSSSSDTGDDERNVDSDNDDSNDEAGDGGLEIPDDFMALVNEAFQRTGFLSNNVVSHWIAKARERDWESSLALLLFLLPNISTMTVFSGGALLRTIDRIVEVEKLLFLNGPTTVNIVCGSQWDDIAGDYLKLFATLPQVHSIHFEYVNVKERNPHFDLSKFIIRENRSIKNISFTDCTVGPILLSNLLEGIEELKSFSSAGMKKYKSLLTRVILLAHAKHSLESLTILSSLYQPLGTLRKFTALKKLKTNTQLLWPIDGRRENDTSLDELPSSLEELNLDMLHDDRDSTDYLTDIISEIVRARSGPLPNLTALKFDVKHKRAIERTVKALIEECQGAGIELTVLMYSDPSGRTIEIYSRSGYVAVHKQLRNLPRLLTQPTIQN